VEVVVVLRVARVPILDVHLANLAGLGWVVVIAVVDVLATARGQARPPVHCKTNAKLVFVIKFIKMLKRIFFRFN
jgi:hypothetical protein